MEDYKSNSHKARELEKQPDKKIEKVVTSEVRKRKRGEMQKLADIFVAEDVATVKSHVFFDVIVPAVKKLIYDVATNGLDMILYGGNGQASKSSTASKISYKSYYDKRDERRNYNEPRVRAGYDYDDVVIDTKGEAEDVLSRMDELVATYGMVSVADFYDLVGITGNYTDNKYGWTDIRNATVVRVRDGFVIKMPRAVPLD